MPDSPALAQLIDAARQAQQTAYAPYSSLAVGAAVLTTAGQLFPGCNVENASYGLSICAERSAVIAAVLAGMQRGQLAAVAIFSSADKPVMPCGACLQVLSEFAAAGCLVASTSTDGKAETLPLAELLPRAFELPAAG
jgi:cytidine deaminase